MLQIYTDETIKQSKDAQLFIKALIKECHLQNVSYAITEVINTSMPFVLPTPNDLSELEIELLSTHRNNIEVYVNIADIVVEKIYHDILKTPTLRNSNVAVFGGSGKVAQKIYNDLYKRCFDFGKLELISSKTDLHEVAKIMSDTDIVISALPFNMSLDHIDIYDCAVYDVSNSLWHSEERTYSYCGYRELGELLTNTLVKYSQIKGEI